MLIGDLGFCLSFGQGKKNERKEMKVITYDVWGKASISYSPIHRLIYDTTFQFMKGASRPVPMKCTCFCYMLVKRQVMRREESLEKLNELQPLVPLSIKERELQEAAVVNNNSGKLKRELTLVIMHFLPLKGNMSAKQTIWDTLKSGK